MLYQNPPLKGTGPDASLIISTSAWECFPYWDWDSSRPGRRTALGPGSEGEHVMSTATSHCRQRGGTEGERGWLAFAKVRFCNVAQCAVTSVSGRGQLLWTRWVLLTYPRLLDWILAALTQGTETMECGFYDKSNSFGWGLILNMYWISAVLWIYLHRHQRLVWQKLDNLHHNATQLEIRDWRRKDAGRCYISIHMLSSVLCQPRPASSAHDPHSRIKQVGDM